jgi:hypothetical protein
MEFTREDKLKIWDIVWSRFEEDCDDSNRSEFIDQYLQRKGYLVFQKLERPFQPDFPNGDQEFVYIKLNSKRNYLELSNELALKILTFGYLPDLT